MSNPNNSIGTPAAYGGRTSVNAYGDELAGYSRGILSGWGVAPAGGLDLNLGGSATVRDVAVAEDNAGNKTTINNISASPITVTIPAAPGTDARIDSVVLYVDASPQGISSAVDNPGACGVVIASGTVAASPTAPDDNTIRAAITADGATGTLAYYTVIANVTVSAGQTDITAGDIAGGNYTLGTGKVRVTPAYTNNQSLGYGYTGNLRRVGNTVTFQSWGQFNANIVDSRVLTETIPYGYRPIFQFYPQKFYADNINDSGRSVTWRFSPDGTIRIHGGVKNGDIVLSYITWQTNDDFPV